MRSGHVPRNGRSRSPEYAVDAFDAKFSDLMEALVRLDENIRISVRYIEPKPFLKNADLLRRLCNSGNIELLYVSLQSGSQRILREMNRNYNIEKVASVYSSFRSSTDTVFYCNWMVGFPGETERDFQDTIELVKTLALQINVAIPFSARPDTPAENLNDQISEEVKKQRVEELTRVIAEVKMNQFRERLDFLDATRLTHLLEQIRTAEAEQYEASANRESLLTFHRNAAPVPPSSDMVREKE